MPERFEIHEVNVTSDDGGESRENRLALSSAPHDDRDTSVDRVARLMAALARPAFAVPLLALLGAMLYLLNLGGYPLYTKGEPREAVTIFDIVNGGGVILPMRAGVEIPSKPLLMHWLGAILSLAAGHVSAWTVRLPSALFAIGGMLVCYGYVRRLFDERAGLVAALMLGTTFQYLQAGGGARVDMTLTFWMELAFFEFIMIAEGLSGRVTLLYLAMALAVLTKGPIGAALPGLVAVLWIALYRRWDLIASLHPVRGLLILLIVGGGWYAAAIASGGMAFVHKQLLAENVYRLFARGGAHLGHAHPFYYEEGALLAGFMPWTLVALLALMQALREPRPLDRSRGYLLVWTLTVLVFYNLPHGKRGIYLLALYPALSAMIALPLSDATRGQDGIARLTGIGSRVAGMAFIAIGLAAAVGLAALLGFPDRVRGWFELGGIAVPEFTAALRGEAMRWLPIAVALPVLFDLGGIYLMLARPRIERLILGVAGGVSCVALAINLLVEPALAKTLALDHFASDVRESAGRAPVGYFGNLDYDFAFYNGRDLILTTPLDPNGPALLVSPEDDWNLVPPRLAANYTVLLRSNPTDLDGSGRMLLLRRKSSETSPLPDAPGLSI